MQRKWIAIGVTVLLAMMVWAGAEAKSSGLYGGGGPLIGQVTLPLDDLNARLRSAGYEPLEGAMLYLGGGGAGGTWYWNMGGWGIGGDMKSSNGSKEAKLTLGLGGFSIQRSLPMGPVTLSGGVLVGGGEAELVLITKANPTLDEAIAGQYEATFQNTFFTVIPTAGMRVKLTDFLFLQAEGGYLATLGDWKFQGQTMSGLPSINGPMIKVGLIFGGSSQY